jgi:hypothetical protein
VRPARRLLCARTTRGPWTSPGCLATGHGIHILATVDAFTPSFDNEGIYEFVESQSDPALKQGIEQREQPGTIRCDKR